MSEQPHDADGTGGQPPSRPGVISWVVAAVALIGFIAFLILN